MSVNSNLRRVAFSETICCGITYYMPRKSADKQGRFRRTYLQQWRLSRGYTQAEFIRRLDTLLENVPPEERKVPKTAASLSRIENGGQPYNQQSLEAFAAVLDIEVASLIGRDPTKEGKVISLIERLSPADLERATRLLEAAFGDRTGTDG